MIHKLRYFSFFLVICLFFGGLANGQKKAAEKDLPNFAEVNQHLYRGGQPTEAGIKRLREDFHIKTIIDLRGADERAKKEAVRAREAGINFINVPLNNWFGPKDKTVEKIIGLIDAPENQPVFVHCQRGSDRTGTIVAVYRISHDNYTAKQAIGEAKDFGLGWWQIWMKDYIKDYYKDFAAGKLKPAATGPERSEN